MKYYSLHREAPDVSFQEAVIKGLAPDKGLYFPSEIKALPPSFYDGIERMSYDEIAYAVIRPFVGNAIPESDLKRILKEVLSFNFPLVEVEDRIFSLELYHGPTLAFKDVGARFMARCLGYFNQQSSEEDLVTVLVATSGDTGGAVASGFYNVEGVEVVILYPSGKVSEIQEKQLTTFGKNIKAVEVDGTFDDCQAMVKKAFLDSDFNGKRKLTSANSINVARWLPQMFYYFFAYRQLKVQGKEIVFSVPSGNFGNICAGMMAKQLGLPVSHFVTGTNANKIVPEYLKSGRYLPQPSVATISNAMDVGDPSNFIRILEIYKNNYDLLKDGLSGFDYTDEETLESMLHLFKNHRYIIDPHGAIGYRALKEYLGNDQDTLGVFLETAHPVKFLDVVPASIRKEIIIPKNILSILEKEKQTTQLATYSSLKTYLLK